MKPIKDRYGDIKNGRIHIRNPAQLNFIGLSKKSFQEKKNRDLIALSIAS
jgi:hypothetical protein